LQETHIEEFYSAQFAPDGKKVIAAGKLKQREKWSEEDEDNEITPAPIKVSFFILFFILLFFSVLHTLSISISSFLRSFPFFLLPLPPFSRSRIFTCPSLIPSL
jgi:hypothetical protein